MALATGAGDSEHNYPSPTSDAARAQSLEAAQVQQHGQQPQHGPLQHEQQHQHQHQQDAAAAAAAAAGAPDAAVKKTRKTVAITREGDPPRNARGQICCEHPACQGKTVVFRRPCEWK
ncbi:hypothetical protein KEM52_004515 [Ascosphaera acerosa]|nr:hypothetical protein KEM52_004515 [Ascosphaera acerosa]